MAPRVRQETDTPIKKKPKWVKQADFNLANAELRKGGEAEANMRRFLEAVAKDRPAPVEQAAIARRLNPLGRTPSTPDTNTLATRASMNPRPAEKTLATRAQMTTPAGTPERSRVRQTHRGTYTGRRAT